MELFASLLAYILPYLGSLITSFVKRKRWSKKTVVIVSIIVSFMLAGISQAIQMAILGTPFTLESLAQGAMTSFGVATAIYHLIQKGTKVDKQLTAIGDDGDVGKSEKSKKAESGEQEVV